MVLEIISNKVDPKSGIQIQDYILDKFAAAKLTDPFLDVIFCEERAVELQNVSQKLHGQLKCKDLSFPFERSSAALVPIKNTRVLVSPYNEPETTIKKILELTLDVSHNDLLPGDTIGIIPTNAACDVDLVLHSMKLLEKAETCCSVQLKADCVKKSAKVPAYVPSLSTPLEILRDCLTLRVVPKKQFLSALASCCSDVLEQRFLNCLSSKEGAHFYNELILQQGHTFLDLLRFCRSCCPPLSLLLEHLPRLLPRPYSIACSPLANNEIKIIFSILPQRPGVATQMLERLCAELDKGSPSPLSVNMYFRQHNKFRYTRDDAESDNILIGIGTGVAPFLGFLEHKQILSNDLSILGKTWLFSGAKTHSSAFGRKSFYEYESHGTLQRYFEAFSKEIDWPTHHIQDLLQANCMEFVEFLMAPKTCLYVCADGAQISKSIEAGIKQCLMQALTIDDAQAAQFIKDFRSSGKYREDLWV